MFELETPGVVAGVEYVLHLFSCTYSKTSVANIGAGVIHVCRAGNPNPLLQQISAR